VYHQSLSVYQSSLLTCCFIQNLNSILEPLGNISTLDLAKARYAFDTNVIASVALTQAALPVMHERGVKESLPIHGRIINVSSGSALNPFPSMAVYSAYVCTFFIW